MILEGQVKDITYLSKITSREKNELYNVNLEDAKAEYTLP